MVIIVIGVCVCVCVCLGACVRAYVRACVRASAKLVPGLFNDQHFCSIYVHNYVHSSVIF